jgi:hypothetical protein
LGFFNTPILQYSNTPVLRHQDFQELSATDLCGSPVNLKSTLSEDSFDFGLTFRF